MFFNLQGGEVVMILLLALVVLGPEKLPQAMRKAGQMYAELKKMSSGFQEEFKAAMEEPIREVRETADLLRESADFRTMKDAPASSPGEDAADEVATDEEMADDTGSSPGQEPTG